MSSLSGRKRADGQRTTLRLGVQMPLSTLLLNWGSRYPGRVSRAVIDASYRLVAPRLPDGVVRREVTIGDDLRAHLYKGGDAGLLVYLHGGGFCLGSLATHGATAAFLAAEAGCSVLLVDYRLAPEHPYPAALEDTVAAYRWARAQGYAKVVVGGDSAGGQLAAALCQAERPDAALLIYPVADADVNGYASAWRFERGPLLSRRAIVGMLGHYRAGDAVTIAGDLGRFPPTYVATAGMDPIRDQGERLAERLADAGVAVEQHRFSNLPHGFIGLLTDPPARAATAQIATALRDLLA